MLLYHFVTLLVATLQLVIDQITLLLYALRKDQETTNCLNNFTF